MGKKYEALMASMEEELKGGQPNPAPVEDPKPVDDPQPNQDGPKTDDPKPDDTPPVDDPKLDDPKPVDDPKPDDPKPADDKQKRDIPDDPVKRAEFSFKRQLAKKDEKHAKELADRDAKYAELEKKFSELEKKVTQPERVKTREEFQDDEDYLKYLADVRVKELMNKRDEEMAKKEAEKVEADRKAQAEREDTERRQNEWLENVSNAFGDDRDRAAKFLERVKYCNDRGLGEILDQCPVAADYLVNDPAGPLVFEKMLNDKAVFEKVFNPRRLSPMAIYWELKDIENGLKGAPQQQQDPAPQVQPNPVPHMGKPGRQAGGAGMTNIDMFNDPKAVKKWLKEHR